MSVEKTFRPACEVIDKIEQAGGEAYIVGGSVRDYLIGRPIGDIDIATSEPPEHIQAIFDKVIPVGIEHGTVIVRHHSQSFEITTYRTEEGYEDFRHPDEVTFVKDITTDLARRDFTMNAMAMDKCGRIVDPYGGREAISHKLIEAVGKPLVRFQEDPLRMMRAIRFASQLSFKIEPATKEALKSEAGLLTHISIERIAAETEKLFAGKDFHLGLKLLEETRLSRFLPILDRFNFSKDLPQHSLHAWSEIIPFYVDLRPAISIREVVKAWKLSNATKRDAEHLLQALQTYKKEEKVTASLVYRLPQELNKSFQRLCFARGFNEEKLVEQIMEVSDRLPIHSKSELRFQANDLIALYADRDKGPWIAKIMNAVECKVVTGTLENDYEKIKEWVFTWNPPASN